MKVVDCLRKPSPLTFVVTGAFTFGLFLRFVIFYRHLPLWVDEAWTGAIVSQPTLRATIDQSLLDPNAPAYFVLMHFWTSWFGLSDAALRLPSFVFGAIAPLVALLPTKGMDRSVQLLWCGLIALWVPEIWYSQEARCYNLAFLLVMACTLAYVRLLARPNMRTAVGWVLFADLIILTQYHSLLLVACQGIGYLAVRRSAALRTWPAALLFLPTVAWMAVHVPRVLQYADPKAAYYSIVRLDSLPNIIAFVVNDVFIAVVLLIGSLVLAALARQNNSLPDPLKLPDRRAEPDVTSSAVIAAGMAAISAFVVITVGSLRPTFTTSYLIVFMPGILLGLSLLVAQFGHRWKTVPVGVILLFGISAFEWSATYHQAQAKLFWNFEEASHEFEKYKVDQIIFLLDSPVTRILKPSQIEALGGFFFKRQGLPITVTPVFMRVDDDPNLRLLASTTNARSAILWLYNLSVRNTAAISHPPRIELINHTWDCNNYGNGTLGVYACHRK